ncbi:NAD(P)-binding domain-containing protein [Verrucosispora sp. WMMA2044]|uniref:NAD(P)-binding domain-containing protein n=1 Tax=Verrucosispora sp. WMMA2044 TaxID=3016419 RepID=UPI0032B164DE
MSSRQLSVKGRSRTAVALAARAPSRWLGELLPGEPEPGRLLRFALVNACTVTALLLGASAILLATNGELRWASLCLLGCFTLDGIDGALARRFAVTSPFGAQMDSLADLCGFGLATPLLAYHWLSGAAPLYVVAAACAGLAVCAMIRLARFNVLPKDGRYFTGLPAAMPAVILAVTIQLGIEPTAGHVGLTGALAVLMVTTLPYSKFGPLVALPRWVWPLPLAALMAGPRIGFGLAAATYLSSGPALGLVRRVRRPAPAVVTESLPGPPDAAQTAPSGLVGSASTRHIRIAIVGAGFAGLGMAMRLTQMGIDDFLVLERADDVGGTWRDNVYPGAASDVPSNLYSYSFAPDPDWTSTFPSQPEIQRYLRRCANDFGLEAKLRFRHELMSAEWQDEANRWCIDTSQGKITADVLIVATGPLSRPATPRIPGLDEFAGTTFHTATWDPTFDLSGKRVAVIGTGASAVQFIPEIQPAVSQLYVFQRTPPWVIPRWNRKKTGLEKKLYRKFPQTQRIARTAVYLWRESFILGLRFDQHMLRPAEWLGRRHLHRQVSDPELRAALTPDHRFGCKRVVLSSTFYPAVTRANTELVRSAIQQLRRNSIVTVDGTERVVDTIIFGTGFEPANMPIARRLRGRDGRLLADAWRQGAQAYLGTAITGYPNLFMLLGPNTVSGQNSSLLTMEAQVDYAINAVRFMEQVGVAVVEVRPEAQASFVSEVQSKMTGTVWASGCRSWYLDDNGRNTTLWPSMTRSFRQRTRRFDHENYVLQSYPSP